MKWNSAEQHLLAGDDTLLAELIQQNGPIKRQARDDYFASLARSITGQQISVKAAAAIFRRFEEATGLDPARVAELDEATIKTIGFSGRKWSYIHDLAVHFVQDSSVYNHLESLPDNRVIEELTTVKGIGVWTAQMFLMFTLLRPDVFAPDDRGLQLGVQKLYNLPHTPSRSEIDDIASRWAPYRTTAAWHLWHSLDNQPV